MQRRMSADVFVKACLREEFEELQLSQGPQAEQGVIKRKDLFDGDLTTGRLVEGSSYCTVGALTNSVQKLIVITYNKNITVNVGRMMMKRRNTNQFRTWGEALGLCEKTL